MGFIQNAIINWLVAPGGRVSRSLLAPVNSAPWPARPGVRRGAPRTSTWPPPVFASGCISRSKLKRTSGSGTAAIAAPALNVAEQLQSAERQQEAGNYEPAAAAFRSLSGVGMPAGVARAALLRLGQCELAAGSYASAADLFDRGDADR